MDINLSWALNLMSRELESAVVVATFPNRTLAALAASFLEADDIEAFILADDAGGAYPMLQFIRGVRLLVAPEDEDRAREILAELVAVDAKLPET